MRRSSLHVLFALAIPLRGTRGAVLVEKIHEIPQGWSFQGEPSRDENVELSIALRQPGIGTLKSRLDEISNPDHPHYGHHLSREEVKAFKAPDPIAVRSVIDWLESNGIKEFAHSHDWIKLNTTVGEASSLLEADLGYYSFAGHGPVIRGRSYTVPNPIAEMIDFIHPVSNFMPPISSRLLSRPATADSIGASRRQSQPCNGGTTPGCIKELYNLQYNPPAGKSPARFGIAGFLEQFINYADTKTFMDKFAPSISATGYNFSVELIHDGQNPQTLSRAGMEASLDVQYAMALGYPTEVVYYSTGGRGVKLDAAGNPYPPERTDNEPYVDFIEHLLKKPDDQLPHVISISYADDEQSVPAPYALRVCDLLASLTARGVSILSASGDGGSRGIGQLQCYSNDGKRRNMTLPTFPASCPYVTAIGATSNNGPPVPGASYSTGGFSNLFARPAWQESAVQGYITALGGHLKGLYNETGRAFPDVSAVGSGFAIEWAGGPSSVLGTSASAPVVAAMFALINDSRLRAGKNATGWLNPTLYSEKVRGVLQDIVDGSSQSCIWDGTAPGGWPAKAGYDCITGLGVPNDFQKLLAAFA
jgi:tripeptidyl-peptidase I